MFSIRWFTFRLETMNRWLASMKRMKYVMPLRMTAVFNKKGRFFAELRAGCDDRRSFLASGTLFLGEALWLHEGAVSFFDCGFTLGCAVKADDIASSWNNVVFVIKLLAFLIGCNYGHGTSPIRGY